MASGKAKNVVAPIRTAYRKPKTLQRKPAAVKLPMNGDVLEALAQVVSFDGGNGKAALAFVDGDGKLHRVTIPHARTRVTGNAVDLDWGAAVKVDYADFLGQRWGYGQAIWDLSGERHIETFQNTPQRYGSPEHVFYALVCMAESGFPSDSERMIAVTCPPGLHSRVQKQIIEGFMAGEDGEGWWSISLNGGKTLRYRFTRVIVLMEGVVSYAAFRFDMDGKVIEITGTDGQDALGGRIVVADAGQGTFDTPILIDGALEADSVGRSTDTNMGIGKLMCEPLLQEILRLVPDANITLAHVDSYLRNFATGSDGKYKPWSEEAGTVVLQGKSLRMRRAFEAAIHEYSRQVYQAKIVPAVRANADCILAVGGGWLFCWNDIQRWMEQEIGIPLLGPYNVDHMRRYMFFEINAIGPLALAAATLRDEA